MSSSFKDLGIGVGLRAQHYEHFLTTPPKSVSWVEVISENHMAWQTQPVGRPLQTLLKVRRHLPVALHGVSLSIGSADPINKNYLTHLNELIDRVEPSIVSDHLCWTGVNGTNLHDLLPLPYTQSVLKHVASKINQVQDFLGRQILIENPSSYLQFKQSEMTEWQFMAELSKLADCGLLLDVNNVYVSSVNHGFDPLEYLSAIPKERVGQIHLAGHSNKGSHLIDTHDHPVCKEVWELYRWVCRHFGQKTTMVERDDNIPEWQELEQELVHAAEVRKEGHEQAIVAKPARAVQQSAAIGTL